MGLGSKMLIVLSGGLLWSCAAPGVLEKNLNGAAGSDPANVEIVERPGGAGSGKANERRCAAARYRAMVGRPINEIDTAALPGLLRVYPVGSLITMDHRPERMNIVVGPDGRVVKVRCG